MLTIHIPYYFLQLYILHFHTICQSIESGNTLGDIPGMEVHHLTKEEFDHGGTRNLAA